MLEGRAGLCTQAGVFQISGSPDHHPEPEAMLRCSGWAGNNSHPPDGTKRDRLGCWARLCVASDHSSEADSLGQPWTLPPWGAVPADVGQGEKSQPHPLCCPGNVRLCHLSPQGCQGRAVPGTADVSDSGWARGGVKPS